MKKQSFLYGATVLAVASLLCKIMSAIFKIPLDRFFLHEEGIAIYQSAYSVYNVFLAVFVTGIPIALSSLVASSDKEEATVLYKSTCTAVTLVCTVCGVLIFAFSENIAMLLSGGGEPLAAVSLKIVSVTLPVMGIISSRRGYFQGMRDMTPSAVSQLAESFIKVVLGIVLCALFVKKGIALGAAGAIAGAALGAFGAAAVLEIFMRRTERTSEPPRFSAAKRVVALSVPMTLGAFGFTAVMLIDSLSVTSLLSLGGMETIERLKNFGYLTRANTVYNLPATIITAFTASAVPAVSVALAEKNSDRISESTIRVVKLIFLAAFPAMMGMCLFAKEILSLLYSSTEHWYLLCLAGVMTLVMPYVQTTTAILQTMGKVWLPIAAQLIALGLKIVLNIFLVQSMGVEGAVVSTIIAFLPAAIMNTVMISPHVNMKELGKILITLFLCSGAACLAAWVFYSFFKNTPALLAALLIAAIIYFVAVVMCGCIKKEEFIK